MESALLYTFSTIAQALGGAFALLSAFVLYRFTILSKSMSQDLSTFRGYPMMGKLHIDFQWFDTLRFQGRYVELVRELENKTSGMSDQYLRTETGDVLFRLRESAGVHERLSKTFKRGALTTGAVMFYSVAAIPFAHIVYCVDVLAWLLLLLGVGGFAACLHLYWTVIQVAIYRQ